MASSIHHRYARCDECHQECKQKGLIMFKGKRLCGKCKRKTAVLMPHFKPMIQVGPRVIERPIVPVRHITTPVFSTSLTSSDRQVLFYHLMKDGVSYEDAVKKIETIKEQIKESHKKYKETAEKEAPSFKESFERMIRGEEK